MQEALDQEQAPEHAALDTGEKSVQGPQHPLDLHPKEVVVGVDLEVRAMWPHGRIEHLDERLRQRVKLLVGSSTLAAVAHQWQQKIAVVKGVNRVVESVERREHDSRGRQHPAGQEDLVGADSKSLAVEIAPHHLDL